MFSPVILSAKSLLYLVTLVKLPASEFELARSNSSAVQVLCSCVPGANRCFKFGCRKQSPLLARLFIERADALYLAFGYWASAAGVRLPVPGHSIIVPAAVAVPTMAHRT